MMYLDIEKDAVKLRRVSQNAELIKEQITPLYSDKVVNSVFHSVKKIGVSEFSYALTRALAYQVFVKSFCVAAIWFSNIRASSVEIHFMINPEKYGVDYIGLGKNILKRFVKSKNRPTLYSYIPAFNTTILKFVLKLGFKESGVIEDGAIDLEGNRCDMRLIVYSNKV